MFRRAHLSRPLTACWALALLVAAAAFGCSSDEKSAMAYAPKRGPGFEPSVSGGQTGALMPACGLTAAAMMGEPIPGGDTGIVLHVSSCGPNFDATALALEDASGAMIDFDVERLDDGVVMLRPHEELQPGLYRITGPQMFVATLTVVEPEPLPMTLGVLEQLGVVCGADFLFTVDVGLLEYLPQLRLTVSIDAGPAETWFDYGMLRVSDGQAVLTLPDCLSRCASESGLHHIALTGELAGELGTLEPISQTFEVDCGEPPDMLEPEPQRGCAVSRPGGRDPPWLLLAGLGVAGLFGLRRRRRPHPRHGHGP